MNTIYIFFSALLIMLASLSGAVFLSEKRNLWLKKNLRYLTTLSLGVFVAITYHLLSEIFHESTIPWFSILGWIALGVLVVEVLSRFIPDAHHHHHGEHDHGHSKIDARRMLLGDALHNIGDGLILVPAFLADVHLGIFTAFAVFSHELIQEISEFFVLKEAGYTTKQALTRNFIVSSTIFIGISLSLVASSIEALHIPLLCFSAGGFIYIISRDLLPHTVSSIKNKGGFLKHLLVGVLGILIILFVNTVLPHEHEEGYIEETI